MSGTHGVLQPNQPGYFYITLEESYVALFKSSAEKWLKEHKDEEDAEKLAAARAAHAVAKAYITDVLVHLSNDLYSRTHSEKNLWVFLSFPQLETRLHGGCKMRTLKDAMKEMIEDAYVFKQPNRDPRYKSLEYRLNLPKYRRELIELPKKVDKNDSANLHDEIEENDSSQNDSANTHDDSANLHHDRANLHDDSAELHAIHNTDITNTEHTHNKDTYSDTDHLQNSNTSPNGDTLSLLQEITNRFGGVEQVLSLLEKLSTQAQQLPTSNTQDKPTSTEADEQASYSHPATQNELPGTPVKEPIQQDTLLPKEEKPTIPVMPPTTAKWCPETAIQIVEAKLGKYYRQVARDKELGFARRMFKEDSELTREQFEAAYDKRNDKWWHDHKGLLHLHHMIEKDRIHEMLDKIEVESIGEYHGNKRIISFPVITQPQKQLVAAGTGFFTEGVLAGQPDYHADPWA